MSLLLTLHISHVIVEIESVLLTLRKQMFATNPCYKSPSTLEQNDIIALLGLFLILSKYLIAGFDISYFSHFWIKINSSFIVCSFLEKIFTKWNANPIASSSKQLFTTNFDANCNVNYFLSSSSFDK